MNTFSHELPTDSSDVLKNTHLSKYKFFLLGQMEEDGNNVYLTVHGEDACVAQEPEDAEKLGIISRKKWDKPDLRNDAYGNFPENMRMIGAGGIVSVQIGNNELETILFEKTAGPSRGRMAQASGLSDQHPFHTMWAEIVEETGVLIVDRDQQRLHLVILEPAELDPAFQNMDEQTAFFGNLAQEKLRTQIQTLKNQLDPEFKDWEIDLQRENFSISEEGEPYMKNVTIDLPGQYPVTTKALIADSNKTANVNLLKPVRLNLPEGTEIICLDPEPFERPIGKFTRAEMLSPDFIERKSSVPMRPYLTEASAQELKPSLPENALS